MNWPPKVFQIFNNRVLLAGWVTPLLIYLLFSFTSTGVSAQPPAPMIQAEKIEQLADHSWVILDQHIPFTPNIGIIVGSHSTLIIDTGTGAANGKIVHDAAVKIRPENKLYLATTHVHPEHDLGAGGFPDSTTMIRSEAQQAEIIADGLSLSRNLQNMSPILRDLLEGNEFRPADITFTDSYELDLGGVTIVITSVGPAHTLGDTAFYVVEDNVLYAGELMVNSVPNLPSQFSDISSWSLNLSELDALKADIIVPSHGELVGTETILSLQDFFDDLMQRTTALNSSSFDKAVAAETLKQELLVKYAYWATNLDPNYIDRVMQSAVAAAFKALENHN